MIPAAEQASARSVMSRVGISLTSIGLVVLAACLVGAVVSLTVALWDPIGWSMIGITAKVALTAMIASVMAFVLAVVAIWVENRGSQAR